MHALRNFSLAFVKHKKGYLLYLHKPVCQRVRQHSVRGDNDSHIAKRSIPDTLLAPTIYSIFSDQESDIHWRNVRFNCLLLLGGERYRRGEKPDDLLTVIKSDTASDIRRIPYLFFRTLLQLCHDSHTRSVYQLVSFIVLQVRVKFQHTREFFHFRCPSLAVKCCIHSSVIITRFSRTTRIIFSWRLCSSISSW